MVRAGSAVVQISTGREREWFSYAKHERDENGMFVEMTGRDPQYVEMYGTGIPESRITRDGKGKISRPAVNEYFTAIFPLGMGIYPVDFTINLR